MLTTFKCRVVLPLLSLAVLQGAFCPLMSQALPDQTRSAGRHGFRPDGRPWLWPFGARDLTPGERDGSLRRTLQGELALTWFLDRGQADLESVSGESRMDPSLATSDVCARVTFADGRTQDFPARVVLGLDRNWVYGPTRIPDGMLVEAILPSDGSIQRLQLVDHQGILAWDAELRGTFFARRPARTLPEVDKDFVPAQAFRTRLNADKPAHGRIDARAEARRELQNAFIKAGIYPPYQILPSAPPVSR